MKFNIRNLLIGLVIVIVLAVVLLRGDQLVELVETMKRGAAIPLVAAVCTQLGKYFAQSFAYSFAFEAVDERMDPRSTLPLVFGTFFMNTIAPSLNLAGTTLVVDDARRRGIEAGKATSAALLMQITIDGAFATIMLIGFLILALTVGLSPLWFLLGLVVIALVSAMIGILILGRKRPALVLRLLRPIERLVDRIRAKFKKPPLNPWVEKIVCTFSDAAGLIGHNPKSTLKAYGCSLVASTCELACFSLVGVGFGVTHPEALICGYVVATLFAMISITPQGVGVVEAAVVVAFTSFGESAAAGTAIGLVYRGIVFWMPFLIGAILIQRTKTFKGSTKQVAKASKRGIAGQAENVQRLAAAKPVPAVAPPAKKPAPDPVPAARAAAPARTARAGSGAAGPEAAARAGAGASARPAGPSAPVASGTARPRSAAGTHRGGTAPADAPLQGRHADAAEPDAPEFDETPVRLPHAPHDRR